MSYRFALDATDNVVDSVPLYRNNDLHCLEVHAAAMNACRKVPLVSRRRLSARGHSTSDNAFSCIIIFQFCIPHARHCDRWMSKSLLSGNVIKSSDPIQRHIITARIAARVRLNAAETHEYFCSATHDDFFDENMYTNFAEFIALIKTPTPRVVQREV